MFQSTACYMFHLSNVLLDSVRRPVLSAVLYVLLV